MFRKHYVTIAREQFERLIRGYTYHSHGSNNNIEFQCLLSLSLLSRRTWDVLFCLKKLPACLANMMRQIGCVCKHELN